MSQPDRPTWNEGERLADRFVVRAFDGAGPLGERYLAYDERSGVEVALRAVHARLTPDEPSRIHFREQMARARSLAHPNLLKIFGLFSHQAHEVMAVQHAPGRALAELAAARDTYAFSDARPTLGQVGAALAHAHNAGVILGDVRPTTVVSLSDTVKVTSVGVALALPRELYLGAVATHPEYSHLAPELRLGGACDARSDVYSLAALALVLLSGTDLESARAGMRPELPAALYAAIDRALDEDPGRRQPNVEAFLSALDRAADAARPRRGPVTLPASITSPRMPAAAPPPLFSEAPSRPAPAPQQGREVTRQIDTDELRRLHGEVSELLETTRQVNLAELESLRRSSREDDATPIQISGRSPSQRNAAARDSGRFASAREPSGPHRAPSSPRSRPPVAIASDLDFDARPGSGRESTRSDLPSARRANATSPALSPVAAPLAAPGDDETDFSGIDLVGDLPLAAPAPGEQVRTVQMDAVQDPFAGLDDEGTAAAPSAYTRDPVGFAESPDPFSAALAAAGESGGASALVIIGDSPSRGPREPTLEMLATDGAPEDAAPPSHDTPPLHSHALHALPTADPAIPERVIAPTPAPISLRPSQVIAPVPASRRPSQVIAPTPGGAGSPRATSPRLSAQRAAVTSRRASRLQRVLLGVGIGFILVAVAGGSMLLSRRNAAPPVTPPPNPPAPVAPPAIKLTPIAPAPAPAPTVDPPTAPTVSPLPPADPAKAVAPAETPPAEMVAVAGGHGVHFRIDAYEYPGKGQLPKVGVSLDEARSLCSARGARLCTAHEWEQACRGEGGASYPYGQQYDEALCNTGNGKLEVAGTFGDCRSKAGAFDMSGNVAEWTERGVVKGGAFAQGNPAARCSHDGHIEGSAAATVGFRCCSDK